MVNGPQTDHWRLCTGSFRRQGLFILMAFVVIYLFYSTEIMSTLSAERWMNKQTTLLDNIDKSRTTNGSSGMTRTNGSTPGLNRNVLASITAWTNSTTASTNSTIAVTNATTAPPASLTTSGFSEHTRLPVVPQTVITSSTPLQSTNTSFTTHRKTTKATLRSIAEPYVSPGPYLVEYPYQYHFIINEPQRCEQDKPFLVLLVPVAPQNKAHRDIIRTTWGGESWVNGKAVRLFFLMGWQGEDVQQQILQESKEHRDLIQSDFLDCYKNLTIKTMVMLEWLDSHCRDASYAMKIDSDMFLNGANLVNMLTHAPKTNYMSGLVARNAVVLRDPSSKWYLPYDVHPPPVYPRYALGLGYVLSVDLAKKLIAASRHVKPLYIEDVFLGLCMEYLKISPTDPPSWNFFHVLPLRYSRCTYSQIIATTTLPSTDRVWVWKDFKKPGPYC